MVNITDKSKCTGCTACKQICPHNAIDMQFDECGHSYPNVNYELCVNCGLCEKICPILRKDKLPKDVDLDSLPVFSVFNKDADVRKRSTSGGIFSLIAEYVINKKGRVYASRFDENYHIFHDCFDSIEQIDPFRGSKYAQSDLKNVFREIRDDLKTGKTVLFVGAPCQVAGLKSFLLKPYENLITCDFVCMGISSPVIWEEYLDAYWSKESIKRIFFKDKRDGWHNWKFLVEDTAGEHLTLGVKDPFFFSYLYHISFRPSCMQCSFRTCRRVSDFTLADCWGIDKVNPLFDDNKGCTALILQSEKAKEIFETIKDFMNVLDYDIKYVKTHNPYITKKIENHFLQPVFYKIYKKNGAKDALNYVLNYKLTLRDKIMLKFQKLLSV